VFLLVACAFASLLVLPVLFSLMCDGSMGSDSLWVAIWTPMWIVDFVQLLSAVLYVLVSSEPESSSSHEEDAPTPAQRVPLVDRMNYLSSTVLFVLVQIFVLIRLDRVVAWSWFVTVRCNLHRSPRPIHYRSASLSSLSAVYPMVLIRDAECG
jgi:hypothetical protein